MKKIFLQRFLSFTLIGAMALGMCACGSTNEETESATEEVVTEEVLNNQDAEAVSEEQGEVDGDELPAYEYPGPELFYTVLYQYLIDELSADYDVADVAIPCPIIVTMDESDKKDIKVWGDFSIYNYELNGETLECVSGGSYPGCIHVESNEEGYVVTDFERVGDGSDFDPTAKKIFGEHYDEFITVYSDNEGKEAIRGQIISNYVFANNLSITEYKDYGWDPVKLPEQNIDSFYSQLD